MALVVWSCVQYTGYWEDYAIFILCSIAGLAAKHFKFSRAAIIIGFVLSDRVDATFRQYSTLYDTTDIFYRPISATLLSIALIAVVYGVFFNKAKVKYV